MISGRSDLTVIRGRVYEETWTWRDDSGALVNLTGWTGAFNLRLEAGGLVVATSPLVLGGLDGTLALRLTGAFTAALDQPHYHWSADLTEPDADPATLLWGILQPLDV